MVRKKRIRVSDEAVQMLNTIRSNDRMFDNTTPRGFIIKELARRQLAESLQESQEVNF
jgi:hypothetical protein